MKTQDEKKEVVPSFNDLVFENRNKEYGAYTIRKNYNAALMWSMLVSVFFISASVITPFIIEQGKPIHIDTPKDDPKVIVIEKIILPVNNPEPEKPEVKIKPLTYVAPVVVDTMSPEQENQILTISDINDLPKNDSSFNYIPEKTRIEVEPENNTINEPFSVTEKPFFGSGGDNEFRSWIAKQIVYPQSCIETNTQGKVYLQFVVEKNGSISNILIQRSVDPELSKEAIRVLELSPSWNPGKINGSPVRVRVNFPITFSLR